MLPHQTKHLPLDSKLQINRFTDIPIHKAETSLIINRRLMLSNRENNPVCWSCLFPCRQICPGSLIMVRRLVSKEGMGAGEVSWRLWGPGCNCSKLASPLQGCSPMWWGISVSESVSTLGTTVLETCSQYLFLLWFSLFWDPVADHFFVLIQANLTVHYLGFDPPSDDLIPSWEQPNCPMSKFLGHICLGAHLSLAPATGKTEMKVQGGLLRGSKLGGGATTGKEWAHWPTEARGGDPSMLRLCELPRPPSGGIWQPFGYSGLQLRKKAGLKRKQALAWDPPNHRPMRHCCLGVQNLCFSVSKWSN